MTKKVLLVLLDTGPKYDKKGLISLIRYRRGCWI